MIHFLLNHSKQGKDMRKGKILIVGGYGSVGRVISDTLGKRFPREVIVAGRNLKRAEALSSKLNNNVIPLELDIRSVNWEDKQLNNISLVIMCIDQSSTHFISQCIKRGIHYIDITANYKFLSQIESLGEEAKKYGSTIVLSVGLAPGISNLLAKHCKTVVHDMRFADIYILLGMGEAHGDAAYRWTFEDINDQFSVKEEGKVEQVASFEDGKKTIFSDYLGKRTAFRSNFADQHVIPRTLDLDSASTRLCTDSPMITWLFALLKKTGGSKLLTFRIVQDYLIKFLTIFPFGSDQYVVKVEAGSRRKKGVQYECSVSGNGEGHITGLVAAKVAEQMRISSFAPGVFHIEQLFEPLEFIESLGNNNLRFESNNVTHYRALNIQSVR